MTGEISTPMLAILTVGSIAESAGGPSRTVTSLAAAMASITPQTAISISLVSGTKNSDAALVFPPANLVRPLLVPARHFMGIARYPGFAPAIGAMTAAHGGAAIVHDNGIWAASNRAVAAAARQQKIRQVVSPRGMLEPWALEWHARRKKFAWWAYQQRLLERASGFHATADTERSSIRRLFPRTPIAIIANGVDCPELPPATDVASTTVLFMSRIHPKKNLIGLLDAWAVICAVPEFAAWRLEIAGPDECGHRADIQSHISKLGLGSRVTLSGHVENADKPALLARAALFILPSFSENFGIVVTEALAAGLPVIATHGAPWAELPAQRCGWWVAPTSAALAGALREALALPPAARREMGERGHRWVAGQFGWDRIAAATACFYRWLIVGGKVPDFVDV